jgi:gas vesicle protein
MATTSSDPRAIEADLERERAALATTLDTLSDRVSVDNLAKEALGMIRSHAGTATTTIDHAVRANPLAVALIGAGVAWMFLGPRLSRGGSSSDYASGYGDSDYAGSTALSSTGYASGSSGGFGAGDDQGWASSRSASDYGRVGYVASDEDDDHSWSREAHGLRARAGEALRRVEEEAKSYYDSLKRGLSSGASGARDFAAERASVVSSFASDLKERFSAGLDNLPPESRDRVIRAREQAYGAMLKAEQLGRDAWRNPGQTLEDHPLVAGAIGFAVGAAVGAMIPSTEVENRTFGAERDRLMDDAARMLRQERERAMQIAGSLGQEIKAAAQETVEAVVDTAQSKATQVASRVGERAKDEIAGAQGSSGSAIG